MKVFLFFLWPALRWYQNNYQGMPQKIIQTSGLVVWDAKYDSFGNCKIDIETIANNLRFPGQYFDAETGLHYNFNRYYDPVMGRYINVDPLGNDLNLYAYCYGEPVNLFDPLGLCAVNDFGTLQGQANFWAGFGDFLTSGFGLSYLFDM